MKKFKEYKKFNPKIEPISIKVIDVDGQILDYIVTEIKDAQTKHLYDETYEAKIEFTIMVGDYEMDVKAVKNDEFIIYPADHEYPMDSKLIGRTIYDLKIILWGLDGQEMNFRYITNDIDLNADEFRAKVEKMSCKV
jgi:hypothetical protein